MRVGITYDLKDTWLARGLGEEEAAEFDRPDTIEAIAEVIAGLGFEPCRIGGLGALMPRLLAGERWDLVFNIAEGLHGTAREAQVPALLEAWQIPCVFSDAVTLGLCLHKGLAKRLVRDGGVPTPDFALVAGPGDIDSVDIAFPLFAKPVAEGTGKGVTAASLVRDHEQLAGACADLLARFNQPVLVEAYLPGREFTVGVVGTGAAARALGVLEVVLNESAEQGAYSWANKTYFEGRVEYRLEEGALAAACVDVALKAWRILGCRDGGRVDVRLDARGNPHFLEVNPLAGLNPEISDLAILCRLRGVAYRQLIATILESALERVSPSQTRALHASAPVLVLHSLVGEGAPAAELDTLAQADNLAEGLAGRDLPVARLAFTPDLAAMREAIAAIDPWRVINLVESVGGRDRLAHLAPALLEDMGLPYTGASAAALLATNDKLSAKRRMLRAGLPTPAWFTEGPPPELGAALWIVKSVWDHASFGIDDDSVVPSSGVAAKLADCRNRFGGDWFAEEYVPGREFNVALLQHGESLQVLPISEIRFRDYPPGKPRVVGRAAKWQRDSFEYANTPRHFPAGDDNLHVQLRELALACWELFELRGYARVDFRVDAAGRPWILEINANPCLAPDAGFVAALERAGLDRCDLIDALLDGAASGRPHPSLEPAAG
ncbi:MAG: hypothetical protein PVG21_03655 [Gammaproteobacteria bacterium]|jgi:D-alanine-D-alanine ligase